MNFLGIGIPEAIIFIMIMLIILGPADMVKVGHSLGTNLRKLWKSPTWQMIFTTSDKIRNLPNTLVREAGIEEMRQELKRETEAIRNLGKELNEGVQFETFRTTAPSTSGKPPASADGTFSAWTTPPDEAERSIAPPSLLKPKPAPAGETHATPVNSTPPTEG